MSGASGQIVLEVNRLGSCISLNVRHQVRPWSIGGMLIARIEMDVRMIGEVNRGS
jgi:hypothetical protein